MFQLIMVVMAIGLTAIVVAGGASYVTGDIGNRRLVESEAAAALAVMGSALTSYGRANSGLYPRLPVSEGDTTWMEDLQPFLPGERMPRVRSMEWIYGTDAEGRLLCLSGSDLTKSAVSGLRGASRGVADVSLVSGCDSASVPVEGAAALVMRIGN